MAARCAIALSAENSVAGASFDKGCGDLSRAIVMKLTMRKKTKVSGLCLDGFPRTASNAFCDFGTGEILVAIGSLFGVKNEFGKTIRLCWPKTLKARGSVTCVQVCLCPTILLDV